MAACALMMSVAAQSPSQPSARDLGQELARRIASAVAPLDQVRLAAADPGSPHAADEALVLRDVAIELRARGLSLVNESDGAARVRVRCSENLRERVCAAEVVKGDARDVVTVVARRAAENVAQPDPLVTLEVHPVLWQRNPILDAAEIGGRLLVLDPSGFDLYRRAELGWTPIASIVSPSPARWPRDPRGRLKANGEGADAFFPDLVCRCTLEPLKADCTPSPGVSWPVGLPNSGLAPGANYFLSARVPLFFSAAPVGVEGGTGWLLAGVDRRLRLLGPGLEMRLALPWLGDDIASLQTQCAAGRAVIAASPDAGNGTSDAIRAYELRADTIVALTPSVRMPGRVTALWETPGGTRVLVVAHNGDLNRYEAFFVGVACVR